MALEQWVLNLNLSERYNHLIILSVLFSRYMKIKDLKVLELASVLAGPSVGSFFSELGAQVIKVENATTQGDVTRKWKLPNEKNELSAYYSAANYNKTSVFLDYNAPADLQKLKNHIQSADIVIVNFKPGDADKFGLGYKDCLSINPDLVYAEITGYGSQSNRTAFDVVLQAETGYISMTGSTKQPAKLPVAFIDLMAAHQLKEGILTALLERTIPAKVSVSLYDTAIASLANQASNYLMNDHIPQPIGTLHPNIAPYGDLFYCVNEEAVVLAVGTEKQFQRLLSVLKLEQYLDQFSNNQKRVQNRESLAEILQQRIIEFERSHFLTQMQSHQIPAGGVYNLSEVFLHHSAKSNVLTETIEGTITRKVRSTVFSISS